MRELLFRGRVKSKVNDGYWWCIGGFHKWETRQPYVVDNLKPEETKYLIIMDSFADWGMPKEITYTEIGPDTIGQYIGRKDKNGNRIFEGDIIKGKAHTYLGYRVKIGVVKYFDTGFVMDIDPNNNNNLDYKNIPNDCEIIGNIYDNPELIKDI